MTFSELRPWQPLEYLPSPTFFQSIFGVFWLLPWNVSNAETTPTYSYANLFLSWRCLSNEYKKKPSVVFFFLAQTRHCSEARGFETPREGDTEGSWRLLPRRRGGLVLAADVRWAPSAWFVGAGEPRVLRWGAERTPAELARRSLCPPACRRRCSPWWLPLGPLPWRSPEQRSWRAGRSNVTILENSSAATGIPPKRILSRYVFFQSIMIKGCPTGA